MKCDKCLQRAAVVYQHHTGHALCTHCFELDLIARVKEALAQYGVSKQDRVLMAVSGGKDSIAMMYLLSMVHPVDRLAAVTVVEGVSGYVREREVRICESVARRLGIEYEVLNVKDLLGYTVGDLVEIARRRGLNLSPCTFCGIIRRRALNTYARSKGFDKVATAHTLNDEVQTALLNVLRGDRMRLAQWHPKSQPHSPLLVKRVKPLRYVYEYELATYAYVKGIPFQSEQCPFLLSRPTIRARLKPLSVEYEHVSPGALLKFVRFLDRTLEPLVREINSKGIQLPTCIKCGEPTAPGRQLCRICELMDSLGLV